MSADQIAEIAPTVREVFAGSEHGEMLCATFQVTGVSEAWVQVTASEVNVAYPRVGNPSSALSEIVAGLPSALLIAWEPGKYATWSFTSTEPRKVAAVVDRMLAELFALGDYSVDCKLESL